MSYQFYSAFGNPLVVEGHHVSAWKCPSNIALVKYWGKKGPQLPANPSLSMTLSHAATTTRLEAFTDSVQKGIVSINGDTRHPFLTKLQSLMQRMVLEIPALKDFGFVMMTANSFPHSAGIASSASGMGAFALCLLDIACAALDISLPEDEKLKMSSFASRLGSGSACRSMYGGFTVWGESELVPDSTDDYAVPVSEGIHPDFVGMHDAILLVSSKPKSLSSSLGHGLMGQHPYSDGRMNQAKNHFEEILKALKEGDIEKLARFSELEALSLHALIMTSGGGELLLYPNTLSLISHIRKARKKGLPVFFTIDAGPNVHLLYPAEAAAQVEIYIKQELLPFCEKNQVILDICGRGPEKLSGN